ncbi:MAG: hypothetical protein ABR956_05740 [Terracidiphilus sp.]
MSLPPADVLYIFEAGLLGDPFPDFHPSDEDLSPGTPVFHPSDEDLSPGTPVFHPSDEDLSPGTPVFHPGCMRVEEAA